ncbi:50S ribosomal protein L20 [Candidatus Peregrinibacteria bacterium]|nr:50S ribosomal protein L20 [Candidatus Peregrinibacteria bacterium]
MRIKGGVTTKKRHKKILKLAKGYRDKRHNVWSLARRAVMIAGKNAYIGRKLKKRDFRSLWINRLNSALKLRGIKYNRFIYALTRKRVGLNRKMLSELAIKEPKVFDEVVNFVMAK